MLDLKVQDGAGGHFQLSRFKGSALLVNFWATWCRPCVAELPHLESLYQKVGKEPGVEILGLCVDEGGEPARILANMRQQGLSLPLAFETQGLATRSFGVATIPTSLLVTPGWVVRHVVSGARDWSNDQWARGLRLMRDEGA
ncbi:MAG: TlpA disulfide reductase family protein [Myxococcota bacterium]|nr:TlpA disulfide reductase family protein [Myxococcota bacterium]